MFAPDETGALRFTRTPAPTDRDVARLLATIATRVGRLLRRRGLAPDEDARATVDPVAEDAPLLAALSRASIMGLSIFGRRPGTPVLRVGRDPDAPWVTSSGPRHAHLTGFDLHANRTVRADDRAGLEALCRYLLRPPLAQERLAILPDGRISCTLAHPWSDGTRALLFEPLEFLEKLATLVPRPRINLLLYHGILAAHAHGRADAVGPPVADDAPAGAPAKATATAAAPPPRRYFAWAELLRRVFAIDVLACTCGGRLRFIATIEDPAVVQRILRHVGLPTEMPEPAAARPPPAPAAPLAFDFPA